MQQQEENASNCFMNSNSMHTSNDSIIGMSWHPHVYGKPPKHPTSYLIEDILGIRDNSLNSLNSLSSSASTTTSSKSNGMSSVNATSVSADKSHKQVIHLFYE